MRVGLVPDVPDQTVLGRVEHVVQRHRQLHHPETRPQVAPGDRHGIDGLGPQLVRELAKVALRKRAKIPRVNNAVKEGEVER
ncbi:hypothetical protein OPKNFCMD_1407 [Methylobacterium crusticola]|uniref:Uncharacterized protein n=1 Tax=Methylobacterium crusticola TaxID=1697972 RepID=A0ABQ4QUR4_9HYPH|nr:hypothetical protein OPKNFCMD_1407 [Methylobacterium crusticola]